MGGARPRLAHRRRGSGVRRRPGPSGRRQRRSAWATAAGVFALGLAAYAAGRSGSPLCRPDSLWQYHGAWHVLSAAAAGWAARAMAPGPPVSVNQRG